MGYPFTRHKLTFSFDALAPHIDAKTMQLHSEKHHQGYTDKLNAALEDHTDLHEYGIAELLGMLDDLPESIRTTVRNNGGGFANHNLFFAHLSPEAKTEPNGELADAITKKWDSLDNFKAACSEAAKGQFGSGWAFLTLDEHNELYIAQKPNQDTPLHDNHVPILGIDVWEHAYYLQYQNKRGDYLDAIWQVIDWVQVEKNYMKALNT